MNIDRKNHIPIYLQVKDQLAKHIADNHLKSGDPLPTLWEICDLTGVSLRTAQKAANALLEEGIGKRLGRQLVVGDGPADCRDVYILCLEYKGRQLDDISTIVVNGIQEELAKLDNAEIVFAGNKIEESLEFYLHNPAMRVRGAIMLHWENRKWLSELAARYPDVRFVQVNYILKDYELLPENVSGVFNDDFAGAYQAAEYLIDQGCRSLAFLEIAIDNETYRERRRGFLAAVNERQVNGRVYVREDARGQVIRKWLETNRVFFEEVYSLNPEMDAVLCCNDPLAYAAAAHFKTVGRPEVPVIGYDGYMNFESSDYNVVAVDYQKMGRYAVRILSSDGRMPRFYKILPQIKIRRQDDVLTYEGHKKLFKIVSF